MCTRTDYVDANVNRTDYVDVDVNRTEYVDVDVYPYRLCGCRCVGA